MPISNNDPLLGLEVQVVPVESGGFLVTQMPGGIAGNPAQHVQTYAATMDDVSALLTAIYTPPVPPP